MKREREYSLDGLIRVDVVPSIEDLEHPTLDELAAGINITSQLVQTTFDLFGDDVRVDTELKPGEWLLAPYGVLVVRHCEPWDADWQIGEFVQCYECTFRYVDDTHIEAPVGPRSPALRAVVSK
jgi:hypothetical protein